jgi:hypothetical protein
VKGAEEVSKGNLQYRINTRATDELVGLINTEQASKQKSRMPTRQLTGEGSTNREEVDNRTGSIRRGTERGMPER